jgi:hypothetical protein
MASIDNKLSCVISQAIFLFFVSNWIIMLDLRFAWFMSFSKNLIWDRHNLFKGEAYLMIMIRGGILNTFSIDENFIKKSVGEVFLVGSDIPIVRHTLYFFEIRVIKKLPNSKQSNKGKFKTHKYINTKLKLTL